jgi:hypothetical protein
MKPMALLALAFVLLWAALLTGCAALGPVGISFETDFGRFTYQVPEIPSRTLGDK